MSRSYKKEPNRSSGAGSTIAEMKNLPEGLSRSFDVAESKIRKLED